MSSETLFTVLGYVINAVFLCAGLYVYISLARQISARPADTDQPAKRFGLPEIILAAILTCFFVMNVGSSGSPPVQLSSRYLIAGILFTLVLVAIIAGLLKLRGFDLERVGGFARMTLSRGLAIGAILLLAAYPLVLLSDVVTQHFLGSGSRQTIVELFSESHSMRQRALVIVLAVAIAPMAEEFIFRFFIYGVLKRYFGLVIGVIVNALLFGAAHGHLPSFAPLVVLGMCFTIAYEWSGSILVSMAMHSLFNSVQLIFLAFPEILPQ